MTRKPHRNKPAPQTLAMPHGLLLVKICALLFSVLAVYWPDLHGGPLWDDGLLIFANPLLRNAQGLFDIWFSAKPTDYFPVTLSLLWAGWHLWGAHAVAYHLLNVALHCLNALLVWRVLWRLKLPGAYWAALLFSLHPICVFSVAWLSELKNTISMLFALLCMDAFVLWLDQQRRSAYLRSLLFYSLAVLSKTSVVMLPFGLLALLWWRRDKLDSKALLASLPYFALSLGSGILTIWFQLIRLTENVGYRPEPMLSRIAAAGMAIWFYFWKLLIPIHLIMVYPRWQIDERAILNYMPLLFLIIIFIALFIIRHKDGKALACFISFLILPMAPILGLVNMAYHRYSLVANHFIYLCVPVFAYILVMLIFRYLTKYSEALVLSLALIYALLAFSRAHAFSSEERLWRDTIAQNSRAWVAYGNLAYLKAVNGKPDEALPLFSAAIDIYNNDSELYRNRGNANFETGHLQEAMQDYSRSIQLKPQAPRAYLDRALLLLQLNRPAESEHDFNNYVLLSRNPVEGYAQRAQVYAQLRRPREALRDAQRAAQLGWPAPPQFIQQLQTMAKIDSSKVLP